MANQQSALFVCLGNICRSVMAEGIFNNLLKERGLLNKWLIDSAATSTYEIGNPPDDRAMTIMKERGLSMAHTARQITADDFTKFRYIFGMDKANIRDLKKVKPPGSPSEILLLGNYDPTGQSEIIEDPYYETEMKAFETVYEQCTRSCEGFLDSLSKS